MASRTFIPEWVDEASHAANPNVLVLREKAGARSTVMAAICEAVKDHLVGLAIIEEMGFPIAAAVIRNRLPMGKRIRSGDLGEILATEYVEQKTTYLVPIKRLRYKDDRNMAMRGTDVVAFRASGGGVTRVLKVEVKSRATLSQSTVKEATDGLLKDSCRPNPSTLAFISLRLRETGKVSEARIVEDLQIRDVSISHIEHLVFTMSGNDPSATLAGFAVIPSHVAKRRLVGLIVPDHQAFIADVFGRIV